MLAVIVIIVVIVVIAIGLIIWARRARRSSRSSGESNMTVSTPKQRRAMRGIHPNSGLRNLGRFLRPAGTLILLDLVQRPLPELRAPDAPCRDPQKASETDAGMIAGGEQSARHHRHRNLPRPARVNRAGQLGRLTPCP